MRRPILPLILAVTALAAVRMPAAAQNGCTAPESVPLAISAEPVQVAPGESAPVNAFWWSSYAPPTPVPANCRVTWQVEPREAGRVSRGSVRAAATALPGSEFTLVVRVGSRVARQTVHVVDPRPNPLAGYWSQRDTAACTGGGDHLSPPETIRELILRRDSAFSLTAVPFETRRDYWGRYSYDEGTGELRLVVENANQERGDLALEGTARVVGDELRLEGFWLGDVRYNRANRTCAYVFTRRR